MPNEGRNTDRTNELNTYINKELPNYITNALPNYRNTPLTNEHIHKDLATYRTHAATRNL